MTHRIASEINVQQNAVIMSTYRKHDVSATLAPTKVASDTKQRLTSRVFYDIHGPADRPAVNKIFPECMSKNN